MKKTLLLILLAHFAFEMIAQKVEYVALNYPVQLPPLGLHEMKITDSMRFFHYRAFGVDTEYIPTQSLTNYLSDESINLDLSRYTRTSQLTHVSTQILPHFYIDFFYYKPVVLEKKIIKKEYIKEDNSKLNGMAYFMTISAKANILFRSLTLDTLFHVQIPAEELTYTIDHLTLPEIGYKPVSEIPFSNIDVLLKVVNEANDLIYKNMEIEAAKHFTYSEIPFFHEDIKLPSIGEVNGYNNIKSNLTNIFKLPNETYDIYIHPVLNEELNKRNKTIVNFEFAKILSLEDTRFSNLKIQEADSLASEYYLSMKGTCMNWYHKKELILKAIDLWKNALGFVKNEPQYPDNNILYDALAFNIAVGYTHLNQFIKARNYLALIDERMEYGIFNNKYTVLGRVAFVDRTLIPARKELFRLRKWIRYMD